METKVGRILTGTARQSGKSMLNQLYQQAGSQLQHAIDQELLNILRRTAMPAYTTHKTWKNRRGKIMHRISVNQEVRKWLTEEHNQTGLFDPEWWVLGEQINITDRLFSLLVLQY